MYVEDVAHFNRLLTKKKWSGNEILNVSTGVATSIVDLAHIVQEVVFEVDGKQIEIIHEDLEEGKESTMVVGRKRLPRELGVMHLKNDKARKFLGEIFRVFVFFVYKNFAAAGADIAQKFELRIAIFFKRTVRLNMLCVQSRQKTDVPIYEFVPVENCALRGNLDERIFATRLNRT